MDFTALQQLSSILEGKLQNCTFAEILSSLQSLSGIPVHPYEQAKYKYFGQGYQFKTINDIPAPVDFNHTTNTHELTSLFDNIHNTSLNALSTLEEKIKNTKGGESFSMEDRAIENISLIDESTIKNNIEFTEIVRSISLNDINTKPVETAQKLLSFYVDMFR